MHKELLGVIVNSFVYFCGGKDLRVIDIGIPILDLGVCELECYI